MNTPYVTEDHVGLCAPQSKQDLLDGLARSLRNIVSISALEGPSSPIIKQKVLSIHLKLKKYRIMQFLGYAKTSFKNAQTNAKWSNISNYSNIKPD